MNNFYCRRCTYANENFVIKTMSFRQKFLNSLRFQFNVNVKCAKFLPNWRNCVSWGKRMSCRHGAVLYYLADNFCLFSQYFEGFMHGLINFIDTKASSKNNMQGLCGRCLSEFLDWRYSQSCWYFRLIFVNCCPSNLLSGSPPPPLLMWISIFYTRTVCSV